jgi:hypothetical protein
MRSLLGALVISITVLSPVQAVASPGGGARTLPFTQSPCSGEVVLLPPQIGGDGTYGVVCSRPITVKPFSKKQIRVQCGGQVPRTAFAKGAYLPYLAQEWVVYGTSQLLRAEDRIQGRIDGSVFRATLRNWGPKPEQAFLAVGCHSESGQLPQFRLRFWGGPISKFTAFMRASNIAANTEAIPWLRAIEGSAADITGTVGNDVIVANGGSTVRGLGGNDSVVGFFGAETLLGQDGDDSITGHPGRDVLRGGRGDDALDGGQGKDRLVGGPGNDILLDGEGSNVFKGGSGNDRLNSKNGKRDRVSCGPGKDEAFIDQRDLVSRDCEDVVR